MSELSRAAITDGHRSHLTHHHTQSPSGLSHQLDAERADRISRLAGLERVSTARNPAPIGQLTPGAAVPALPHQGYFDGQGNPVMGRERSEVGSLPAVGNVGGRTTWASSEAGDADKMIESLGSTVHSNTSQASNGDEPRPTRPRTFRRVSSSDSTAVDLRSPTVIVPPTHLSAFSDPHDVAAAMELARMDLVEDSFNEHSVPLLPAATADSENVDESEQNESCTSLPNSHVTEVESESFQQRDLSRHTALVAQELASRWFKCYANQGLVQAVEGAGSRDEEGQDQ